MTLVWSAAFTRASRRLLRKHPEVRARFERALELPQADPFQASLRSHKLRGPLQDIWACSVDFEYRILFELVRNPESGDEEILLLTAGTHEEVY